MKKKLTAAVLAACFLFSGCSFSETSVDALLKPPALSKEQEEIRAAMQADPEVKNNISLVYPRTGEYRSAYVIENIDGESTKEALVFYRENASTAVNTSAIKINVLDQVEDADGNRKWVSRLISNEINASSVEKLSIVELEDQYYIIIGFNLINADASGNTKELKVFSYEETSNQGLQLVNKVSVPCVGYEVTDLDGDGMQDLTAIVSQMNGDVKQSYGAFYHYQDGMFVSYGGKAPLNSSVTEYSSIYYGKLEDGRNALYLDGVDGKLVGTEILALENGVLKSLSPTSDRTLWELTSRPLEFSCMDLDEDLVYEIPKWLNVQESDSRLDLISWSHYNSGGLTQYLVTYTDFALSYRLTVPDGWLNYVGTQKDLTNNETIFYAYNPNDYQDNSQVLLKIKVQTSQEIPEGYQKLDTSGELVYLYQMFPDTMEELNLKLSEEQLKKTFRHL